LNTRSYDFNEVVDDEENEEVHSEIEEEEEEVPEEEEEDQLSVDDSREDNWERDAKPLSSDKKQQLSVSGGSSHHSSDSKADSKHETTSPTTNSPPALTVKASLPPLQSGRAALNLSHNVSMDISSSFEADASTNSLQHLQKGISVPITNNSSQSKGLSTQSESKQDDKHDHKEVDDSVNVSRMHDDSKLSERSASEDEGAGPEVDSSVGGEGEEDSDFEHNAEESAVRVVHMVSCS
jgi:hypothetical protein